MRSRLFQSRGDRRLSPILIHETIQPAIRASDSAIGSHNERFGTLTLLIPGTKWEGSGGWGHDNPLFAYGNGVLAQGCEHASTQLLNWSGGNSDRSRLDAAQKLRNIIAAHRFSAGDRLNILAHSHGGNVALAASRLGLAHRIDNLVTLNKPTLVGDAYQPGTKIGNFLNISAWKDWTQWLGSNAKLSRKWSIDSSALNLELYTASSELKPHGALIWDDRIREIWWNWVLEQMRSRQG
jgi:hypothetical protein